MVFTSSLDVNMFWNVAMVLSLVLFPPSFSSFRAWMVGRGYSFVFLVGQLMSLCVFGRAADVAVLKQDMTSSCYPWHYHIGSWGRRAVFLPHSHPRPYAFIRTTNLVGPFRWSMLGGGFGRSCFWTPWWGGQTKDRLDKRAGYIGNQNSNDLLHILVRKEGWKEGIILELKI
jgi:hypothetical protein